MKKFLLFCFFPFCLLVSSSDANDSSFVYVDGIAAVVGEHIILKSDVAQLVNMAAVQQQLNPKYDMERLLGLQQEILQSAVDQKIMLEMAALDSIEVEDGEVDRALDQQMQMFIQQAGNEARAEEALGQSLKSFRREFWEEMRDRLVVERYQQSLIGKISVSRQDVESFYQEYRDSIPAFPMYIKIRHILFPIQPGQKSVTTTIETLTDLRERIIAGESFADLATQFSQDPGSAKNGGSLGYVRRGALVPEFEEVAFTQPPGAISEIVTSPFGYHLIDTEEKLGDKISVRHILLIPEINDADESLTYNLASAVQDSIQTKEDFIRYVSIYSVDQQTKNIGGDLGWINPKNSPIPEIGQIFNLLEMKSCSAPVKSESGYHLFWLEDVKPGGKATLLSHWPELEQMALSMKKNRWYNMWITSARENFYIHKTDW